MSKRLAGLLVVGMLAGMCYTFGYSAGYDEGEGANHRRFMRGITERMEVVNEHAASALVKTPAPDAVPSELANNMTAADSSAF